MSGVAGPVQENGIDELDRRIIAELQADGRVAFTEIARRLDVAEATVRHRVRRLERRGVLQVVAVIAPLQLGMRRIMVGIRVRGHAVADVERSLRRLDEIDYVAVTTGAYDVVVMAACADEDHVARLVTETLRGIPGVDTLDVVTMLRETKDAYRYVSSSSAGDEDPGPGRGRRRS